MEWYEALSNNYQLTVAGRLLLAALLGGLVGLEREFHGRPAGFRTHLLVSVGACLMMVVSEFFSIKYATLDSSHVVRLDPARIAAQIVTGIGFLGAGAIIKESRGVRGLTTAACLWVAAGLGMAVGAGVYLAALGVTAIALVTLMFLKRLERRLPRDHYRHLDVYCREGDGSRERLEAFLEKWQLRTVNFGLERNLETGEVHYNLIVVQSGEKVTGSIAEALAELEGVRKVRFR